MCFSFTYPPEFGASSLDYPWRSAVESPTCNFNHRHSVVHLVYSAVCVNHKINVVQVFIYM